MTYLIREAFYSKNVPEYNFLIREEKSILSSVAELKAAATGKEAELLRNTTQAQKIQIQQLQELLASREQQHK